MNETNVEFAAIVKRYHAVTERIIRCAADSKRDPKHINLIVVSKQQPVAAIRHLYEHAGVRDFGENYAQDLISKADQLKDCVDLRWHFIGTLQSNKINKLVPRVTSIDSVASLQHLAAIDQAVKKMGLPPLSVSILVNIANEAQKSGVSRHECISLVEEAKLKYKSIVIRGIMAVPPSHIQDPEDGNIRTIAAEYRSLMELKDQCKLQDLSLGMSGDMAMAVAAGSTCLRIGTAIFGPRST